MEHEYGVKINLEQLGFSVAKWVVGGWVTLEKLENYIIVLR